MDSEKKIQELINDKLEEISKKLSNLAHSERASFACGFNLGYKQAMLDLSPYLNKNTDI